MAIVMTRHFPGVTVNIHDDCLIKDEAEIQRRLKVCAEIVYEGLMKKQREEAENADDADAK